MSAELLMVPPPERSPSILLGKGHNCPKCNSMHVVKHSENLSTGTASANIGRKPVQVLQKTVRRIIFRCLECNHKWTEYWT